MTTCGRKTRTQGWSALAHKLASGRVPFDRFDKVFERLDVRHRLEVICEIVRCDDRVDASFFDLTATLDAAEANGKMAASFETGRVNGQPIPRSRSAASRAVLIH